MESVAVKNGMDQDAGKTSFFDLAEPYARMGLPTIRLHHRKKNPIDPSWQNKATVELDQIKLLSDETPDAGVGLVAKNDGYCFLETDEKNVIRRFQDDTGESFRTRTHQSQPGHFHFLFKQTELSRKTGSITQAQLRWGSFRQHNQYIVGPGSLHERTGEPYTVVRDEEIIPIPDSFLNWIISQKTKSEAASVVEREAGVLVPHGSIHNALVIQARRLLAADFRGEKLESELATWADANCEKPIDFSKVRACAKNVESNYGQQAAKQKNEYVTIGGVVPGAPPPPPSSATIKEQEQRQLLIDNTPEGATGQPDTIDTHYPLFVWGNTLYAEFAEFCGRGNFIPKELFIEAIKTVIGGICGHRFAPQEGRDFTILLTKVGGIGKGTAIGAAIDLFAGTGLMYELHGSSAFMNVGTAKGAFGSSAGLCNKGFSQQDRILQVYDEATKLLEKFSIPGSGDAFLDDLNTLYEERGYSPTLTKDVKLSSDFVADRKRTSILAGTTFDKWTSAFGKTTAEGSGFFQRLNIISTDETATVAATPKFDFTEGEGAALRSKFAALVQPLEYQRVVFEFTPEADKLFNEWHTQFKKDHADAPGETVGRLNVLATRNAEHMAFASHPLIKPDPAKASEVIRMTIDETTIQNAIDLAEYQFFVRSKHRPAQGNNDAALVEDSIRLTLLASSSQRMNRSDLYKKSGSKKFGLFLFDKVLSAMQNEGLLDVGEKTNSTTRGRKGQVVLWIGE
jgi:hypothetical protein